MATAHMSKDGSISNQYLYNFPVLNVRAAAAVIRNFLAGFEIAHQESER